MDPGAGAVATFSITECGTTSALFTPSIVRNITKMMTRVVDELRSSIPRLEAAAADVDDDDDCDSLREDLDDARSCLKKYEAFATHVLQGRSSTGFYRPTAAARPPTAAAARPPTAAAARPPSAAFGDVEAEAYRSTSIGSTVFKKIYRSIHKGDSAFLGKAGGSGTGIFKGYDSGSTVFENAEASSLRSGGKMAAVRDYAMRIGFPSSYVVDLSGNTFCHTVRFDGWSKEQRTGLVGVFEAMETPPPQLQQQQRQRQHQPQRQPDEDDEDEDEDDEDEDDEDEEDDDDAEEGEIASIMDERPSQRRRIE